MSAIATPPRSLREPGAKPGQAFVRATVAGAVALAACAAGLSIAQAHPLWPFALMAAFVAWCALAALRPGYALLALLALLPLAGFAPRTGWLTFEEFDLLVLATAAGGYARSALPFAPARPPGADARFEPQLSVVSVVLLAAYLGAACVSTQRGIADAGGFVFGWTQGFYGPMNSVRILKGLVWAVLLAPLVVADLRRPGGLDRVAIGLTTGLGLAALAVVEERHAFIGLLDFSQDYRATGSFWEMHVGGATLDAFLILTAPFAVREGLRTRHNAWLATICVVLALATYAALTTFSRGLYLALVVEIVLLGIVVLRRRGGSRGGMQMPALLKWGAFCVAMMAGYFIVFRSGGYRAAIATLGVFALALRVAPLAARTGVLVWMVSLATSLVLGAAGYVLATTLPKGPYVVYLGVFAATFAALVVAHRRPSRVIATVAVVGWLWLAIAACVVADLWGGHAAGRDDAVVTTLMVVVVASTTRFWPALWQRDIRSQATTMVLALVIAAPVTVFSAGPYMGDRMRSSRDDFASRMSHWSEAVGRMRTSRDWRFGMGLGRYPGSSRLTTGSLRPGSYEVLDRADGRFLRLSAAWLPYFGFGELYRLTQIVPVEPDRHYLLTVQARADQATPMHVELCEKHLLYSLECVVRQFTIPASRDRWTNISVPFDSGPLGRSPWYAPKPIVFALAIADPRLVADIRELHLLRGDGSDLFVNGNFREGTAHWFSSADTNHNPFHIDNFVIGVLFDQGVIGLALLAALVVGALVRTVLGSAHRHPDAAFVAVALVAFLVLGAFDSLIDAPRIEFLFYFVLLLGLMLRNPRVAASQRPPPRETRDRRDAGDGNDERMRRRQQAFGTRRRAGG